MKRRPINALALTLAALSLVFCMFTHSGAEQAPDSAPPPFRAVKTDDVHQYYIRGFDKTENVLFAADYSTGSLVQSVDGGNVWSADKSKPADVTIDNVKKIVLHKGYLYALCVTAADALPKVFRSPYVSGDTPFSWSSPLVTGVAGSTSLYTDLACDDECIYFGEYGDPEGGPTLYKSANGTAWEASYHDDTARHVHAVNADPFHPGHVWLCIGDGAENSLLRSTDHGVTWTNLGNTYWQGVQISFTEGEVLIAGDNIKGTVFAVDKSDLSIRWASSNYHADIAVPDGSEGDKFYRNAFYGAIDPDTGIYYCVANDPSVAGGNRFGLFCLPYLYGEVELLDPLESPSGANGEVFIADGWIWFGMNKYPLLTSSQTGSVRQQ